MRDEVAFLREQLKTMTDRLTAIADARAFQAVRSGPVDVTQFYGSSPNDQYISYNDMGQKVLFEKDIEVKA